ncbi:MAG: 3'-5' exonuclease domain-containing protein 2 [Muribaculaceae bacterium]|nr:3'-5' exonuclease domain-containing protein 2 [Muribaculaceae bacterium]
MLSISKEILAELPKVDFQGRTHLIESASTARDASLFLLKQKMIGFDTETRPNFHKGRPHKVSLLQLATKDECFLFRLNKTGITSHIRQVLESEKVMKIGLSTKDDFHSLARICDDLEPKGFLELQSWVKEFDIKDNSLARIFAIIFGKRISKSQRLTNWEADDLTEAQMNYAALDAWACLEIYTHLSAGHFSPDDSPYKVAYDDTPHNE